MKIDGKIYEVKWNDDGTYYVQEQIEPNFVTIVHSGEGGRVNSCCRLLVGTYGGLSFWSQEYHYKSLIYYRSCSKIEKIDSDLMRVYSKNGKDSILVRTKNDW